jgi:hypothetical protein
MKDIKSTTEESVLYTINTTVSETDYCTINVIEKHTSRLIFESKHKLHRHDLMLKRIKLQLLSQGEEFIQYIRETQLEI